MSRRGRGAGGAGDHGQSTVELALALPLVTLAVLLVVQVGLVVREQLLVAGAAREAARTAAVVGPDDRSAIERATARAGSLDPDRLHVDVRSAADGTVEVSVRYRSRTDLPLVGVLVPDLDLRASAVMRREEGSEPRGRSLEVNGHAKGERPLKSRSEPVFIFRN